LLAALIVGIIATFLANEARRDAMGQVWTGVASSSSSSPPFSPSPRRPQGCYVGETLLG
jgi:hypothetical protein